MTKPDPEITLLLADLDSSDKRRIRAAVDALSVRACESPELRKKLEEELQNQARKNRWPVAYVLASAGEPSLRTLEVLFETLADPDSDIRWAVLLLIVRLGKNDDRVPSLLAQVVENGHPTQRRMAQYCIRDLGLATEFVIPTVLKGLDDPEPLVRVAAIIALKKRPELPEAATGRVVNLFLKDADPRVRSTAAVVLADLKIDSEEFLAGLEVARRSENPQIKKAANAALALLRN
jgi:HEAT repeat protein